ncbi:MAG: HgcAB-associated protein [Thermodesulfobacteriota bacterium]
MVKQKKAMEPCCDPNSCGCEIESIISVDERGQMVLPKELREKAGIKAGSKLAVASWSSGGDVDCIILMKADDLVSMVKEKLAPVIKDLNK